MGLATTIQAAVETAFNALGDITQQITISTYAASPTYTPSTGGTAGAATVTTVPKAIVTSYKSYEVDGHAIKPHDQKVLFPTAAIAVEPKPGIDTVTDASSNIWQIISVKKDAAASMYALQVRLT